MINRMKLFVCFVALGLAPALATDVVEGIKDQVQALQAEPNHRAEILVELMFKLHSFGHVPLALAAKAANVLFPGEFEATSNNVPLDPSTKTMIRSWDDAIAFFRTHYKFVSFAADAYTDARARVERVMNWPLTTSFPSYDEQKEHDRLAWIHETRLVQNAAQEAVDEKNMPAMRALLAEQGFKSHLQNKLVMRDGRPTTILNVMTYLSNLGLETEILS